MLVRPSPSSAAVGAMIGSEAEDDSLTNLQWLQRMTINIVDITSSGASASPSATGYPLPYSPASSTSSDDNGAKYACVNEWPSRHSGPLPGVEQYSLCDSVDYKEAPHLKPPYSYAMLICMAMKAADSSKVTLSAIYRWITDHFVYYKYADPSWQNSIRHNLSLNKCFAKVPRKKGDPGKGGYWMLVPEYADRLLESCQRKRRAASDYREGVLSVKRVRLDSDGTGPLLMPRSMPHKRHHSLGSPSGGRPDIEACRMDHCYNKMVAAMPLYHQPPREAREKEDGTVPFPNALKNDLCWNQSDLFNESMRSVTQDLLDARTLNFINNFGGAGCTPSHSKNSGAGCNPLSLSGGSRFAEFELSSPFCVSPPLSADDADEPVEFTDQLDLTVKGFSMPLHVPVPTMVPAQRSAGKRVSTNAYEPTEGDVPWLAEASQFDVNILIQSSLAHRSARP